MERYKQVEQDLVTWQKRLKVAKIRLKIAENTLENTKLDHQIGIEEKQDEYSLNILRRNVKFARERVTAYENDVEDVLNMIDRCIGYLNDMDLNGGR